MTFARHLADDRLFDCYVAERAGDAADLRAAEHLAECESCGARYTELVRFMDRVYEEAVAEADEVFTPEQLRAQQQQIARRIEAVGRPPRVISFPAAGARRGFAVSATRSAPRWVAAAAAAGLFIGIAVGYQLEGRRARPAAAARHEAGSLRAVTPTAVAMTGNAPADVASDDAFLSELEIALERPRTRELMAIDAFTPHFREIRNEK